MAYDYSSESKQLELPNPYRIENGFLFAVTAILSLGGLACLTHVREALLSQEKRMALVPFLVGVGMLGSALAFATTAFKRLRFFFGRGRPASLAPDLPHDRMGTSPAADHFKAMLRNGGLEYPEPIGALNGLLYHWFPRLITAPLVVQHAMQRHFFNALAVLMTLLSFLVAWGYFGDDATRPWVGLAYFCFALYTLLAPLASNRRVDMSTATLIGLVTAALLGPVAIGLLSHALPHLGLSLHRQTLFLLLSSEMAFVFILLSLFAQVDPSPQTQRSYEQMALSMNAPPGTLMAELERKLQAEWVSGIPNRRYSRRAPEVDALAKSGSFSGELFEETQPMPLTGTTAPTLSEALTGARHRWLVALNAFATGLILLGTGFALHYAFSVDPARLVDVLHEGLDGSIGYSVMCLVVAAISFRSSAQIWGRFNFESDLVWLEFQGVWQSSRIGTGNQLSTRLQSQNDLIRIESMTVRVWCARIESVVFDKDGVRQVTAMFGTGGQAQAMLDHLSSFARGVSVFVAPQAQDDQLRLQALQGVEQLLAHPGQDAGLTRLPELKSVAAELALSGDASSVQPRFCGHCGGKLPAQAKFCCECGQGVAKLPG